MSEKREKMLRLASRVFRDVGIVGEAFIVFGPPMGKLVKLFIGPLPLLLSYICYKVAARNTETAGAARQR